jgi:hypothetical protein
MHGFVDAQFFHGIACRAGGERGVLQAQAAWPTNIVCVAAGIKVLLAMLKRSGMEERSEERSL